MIQYQGEVPSSRASDADRERVLELLRKAAGDGRLSHETFLGRMEQALAARNLAELQSTIEDLPGAEIAPAAAPPAGPRGLLRRAATAPVQALGRVRRLHRIRRLPVLALPAAGSRPLVVGRSPGSDLRLSHDSVSRTHAVLTPTLDGWTLRDLSSMNGTLVNGRRLLGPTPIHPGDWVTFGVLHFRLAAP